MIRCNSGVARFQDPLIINPICHGREVDSAPLPVNFFYHIHLNNPINLIFSGFKFYRFTNILAKFGRSSPGQFGARTFFVKKIFKIFCFVIFKFFFLLIVSRFILLESRLYSVFSLLIPRLIISFKNLFLFQ